MPMKSSESRLEAILLRFWAWAGYDAADFAKDEVNCCRKKEPFDFPEIVEMRKLCYGLENGLGSLREAEDYLTCMALDNEDEEILDHCAAYAPDDFVACIVAAASDHPQWEARWQVAELLGRRKIPQRELLLNVFLQDPHPYVRRRAENALINCREMV